jgi:hypothetical protein
MGTVYLARQLSLDRPVALKVMSRRWADDPVFVARFTREAYAAALLNHPNVVQIFDIGAADGVRYFSMELVPGRSLAELLRAVGKVDAETAVGYVLQAARGLRHAHDRGIVHRDVKPDNILLDDQGMVKVADLGLVKTRNPEPGTRKPEHEPGEAVSGSGFRVPGSGIGLTGHKMALGTPAYMAPEQCRDAATVDHRADVYSLGCTLYALVTGQPPFAGATPVEVMTQHAYAPLTPPERLVSRVPRELSAVIQRMMAKDPGERFPGMGEVVRTLEQWLGVHTAGKFTPRDDQVEALERCVAGFNAAPAAVLRERLLGSAASGAVLLAVLLCFFNQAGLALGLAGLVVQTALAYFVLDGVARRTHLFRRVRQVAVGSSAGDWAVAAAVAALFGLLLWLTGFLSVFVGFGLIAVGLAGGVRLALDRAVEADRRPHLRAAENLLRRLRLTGVDEEELRQFVAKYAGRHWEEFYEALFGFEAKLAARALLARGGVGGEREKFAPWREPLLGLCDAVEKARRQARELQLLEDDETARLVASGVEESAARLSAAKLAESLVAGAAAVRAGGGPTDLNQLGRQNSSLWAAVNAVVPPAAAANVRRLGLAAGPIARATLAVALLGACAMWVGQNRLFLNAVPGAGAGAVVLDDTAPLRLDGVPVEWTGWVDSANVGWAGVLLLASLYCRGLRSAVLVLVGAGVAAAGHRFGILTVPPVEDVHVSWMLGTSFALLGYRVGRG